MNNIRVAIEPTNGSGTVTEWFVPCNGENERKELKEFIKSAIEAYHDWLVDGD